MLDAVGMAEINKIFAVLDALGVHREHVVIPLGTGKGRVRRMPSASSRSSSTRRCPSTSGSRVARPHPGAQAS